MSIWSSYKPKNDDKIDVAASMYGDGIRLWNTDDSDRAELTFKEAEELANKILDCIFIERMKEIRNN